MRIVFAPDSFKGSLSATHVCEAMERGVRRAIPDCETIFVPLADGGEGTLEAIVKGAGGEVFTANVHGPGGDPIEAGWGLLPNGRAIIEMAQASGLTLIPRTKRNSLLASSFGTGELIQAALNSNCREVLIGIGGSATTDGGTGALSALGAKFLDRDKQVLSPGGASLNSLHAIDLAELDSRLTCTSITILCDVTNPLCGTNGAAHIYGPQKGAAQNEVAVLEAGLKRFAHITAQTLYRDMSRHPGAGAAGGMGFGLLAFCNAQAKSGIEAVLEVTQFSQKLKNADLVLTGEGALDAQTLSGKTIAGVCREAQRHSVPVIAFGGKVALSGDDQSTLGLLSAFPIADSPMSLEECIARADELLSDAVERTLRVWVAGRK